MFVHEACAYILDHPSLAIGLARKRGSPSQGLSQHTLSHRRHLWQHSKEKSQTLRKRKLTPAPLPETTGFIGREGGRPKAPCLRSSFAPVTSSWGTGGWVNRALLASAQSGVLPPTSLFTTFCPSFMQLFGFCPCLSVEESLR